MPPRAFPFPLKVGTDFCHIPRIRKILTKNIGNGAAETQPLLNFLVKVLTWPERQYFWDRFKGDEEVAYRNLDKVSTYLAGRWAAKEACRKACTHMGKSNGLHHIMILPVSTPETAANGAITTAPRGLILRERLQHYSKPEAGLSSGISTRAERLQLIGPDRPLFDVDEVEGQFCEVSISHDGTIAQAVAMVPAIDWVQEP